MKKIIETQRAPGAIGPYVQGVDLGSMVFTSGQIPVCPQTGEIPADVQDQARLSLENVKAIVVAAGLSVGDIIKMTVVDSIGQRNSYVKTWGCGGFLNETNIYSRGKSLCF
ncbi:endoribonuclease L-PSP family protein [Escherichia coli EPEC C342-62]|nr:endoribonuclease L-PSP family protein [Escherichia coli EPEC C342-62]